MRRDAPLEHLWVVRDGACRVPPTATVLRDGSREHYEALARARYVVTNDHFPEWFARRAGPDVRADLARHAAQAARLRRLRAARGHAQVRAPAGTSRCTTGSTSSRPTASRRRSCGARTCWRARCSRPATRAPTCSPARTATRAAAALRARLGMPDGQAHRALRADVPRPGARTAAAATGSICSSTSSGCAGALGRRHRAARSASTTTSSTRAGDAGRLRPRRVELPDGTELLLAADVLVTDYSSMMVDFANTGRPMLFFTYDLDAYRDEIRGFYVDFEATVPGPAAAHDRRAGRGAARPRRRRGRPRGALRGVLAKFCELDDGGATGRVVDEVFGR